MISGTSTLNMQFTLEMPGWRLSQQRKGRKGIEWYMKWKSAIWQPRKGNCLFDNVYLSYEEALVGKNLHSFIFVFILLYAAFVWWMTRSLWSTIVPSHGVTLTLSLDHCCYNWHVVLVLPGKVNFKYCLGPSLGGILLKCNALCTGCKLCFAVTMHVPDA